MMKILVSKEHKSMFQNNNNVSKLKAIIGNSSNDLKNR
jgi:hypothetical protein